MRYEVKDNAYGTLAAIEQQIRSALWDADQVDSSDFLWYIPTQQVRGEESCIAKPTSLNAVP